MAALRPSMQAISTEPPTPLHLAYTEKLNAYMEQAVPQESKDRQQKRIAILSDLTSTFKQWVHSVCLAKGLAQPVAEAAGGALFTSGSYRLGLNEVGMDIDAVCVAPRMVTRDDFFETLKVILEDHESIHNLVAIAGAPLAPALRPTLLGTPSRQCGRRGGAHHHVRLRRHQHRPDVCAAARRFGASCRRHQRHTLRGCPLLTDPSLVAGASYHRHQRGLGAAGPRHGHAALAQRAARHQPDRAARAAVRRLPAAAALHPAVG